MRVPKGPSVSCPSCLSLSTPPVDIRKQKDLPLQLKESNVTLSGHPLRMEGWGLSSIADGTASWGWQVGASGLEALFTFPTHPFAFSPPRWGLGFQSSLAPHPPESHFSLSFDCSLVGVTVGKAGTGVCRCWVFPGKSP